MAMYLEPPTGLVTVESALNSHGRILSVIGVVTDFLPPNMSRGTDYQSTFTITDRSQWSNDSGLKVKFFRPTTAELPPVEAKGDIVILRNIKINTFNGRTVALSNIATEWTLVPASRIPDMHPPGDFKLKHASSPGAERPSSAEYRYMITLHMSQNGNTSALSSNYPKDYIPRMPQSPRQDLPARSVQGYNRGKGTHILVKSVEHAPVRRNFPSVPVQYSSEYGSKAATPSTNDHSSFQKSSSASASADHQNQTARSTASTSVGYGGSPKFKITLIKDIRHYVFSDLIGQVVKIFSSGGEKLELYITDYTVNKDLFNYEWGAGEMGYMGTDGDEFGYADSRRSDKSWPGPFGKMTLLVILWSPHSFYAQDHVKEGDIVFLRNVKIKFNNQGGSRLDGWLHQNRFNEDRIDISVIKNEDDELVRGLLERKRTYWKKAKQQQAEYLTTAKNLTYTQAEEAEKIRKRSTEEVDSEPEAEGVVDSRPGKKKRKRNPRGRAKAKQQQQQLEAEKVSESRRGPSSGLLEVNQHVRSRRPEVDLIPLSELAKGIRLDFKSPRGVDYVLPFHNCCCRARVRVVDFFPPNLVDFAVLTDDPELDVLSDSGYSGSSRDSAEIPGPWQRVGQEVTEERWEWRFYLLVEDANPKSASTKNGEVCRLKLMVGYRDAEFLLNMTPEDLRKNPTALARLKEKLFVLWGDLEERKSAAAETRVLQDVSTNQNPKVGWYNPEKGGTHQSDHESGSHSGRPFECCIKEYGVRVRKAEGGEDDDLDAERWERRFMMFDTVIM